MPDRPLGLESLYDSGVDHELPVSEHAPVDNLRVFFGFLLLDGIDSDTLHLRSELDINFEDIIFGDSLLESLFALGDFGLQSRTLCFWILTLGLLFFCLGFFGWLLGCRSF